MGKKSKRHKERRKAAPNGQHGPSKEMLRFSEALFGSDKNERFKAGAAVVASSVKAGPRIACSPRGDVVIGVPGNSPAAAEAFRYCIERFAHHHPAGGRVSPEGLAGAEAIFAQRALEREQALAEEGQITPGLIGDVIGGLARALGVERSAEPAEPETPAASAAEDDRPPDPALKFGPPSEAQRRCGAQLSEEAFPRSPAVDGYGVDETGADYAARAAILLEGSADA